MEGVAVNKDYGPAGLTHSMICLQMMTYLTLKLHELLSQ